jgi:Na+/H+-dicarboxylate symporter
MTQRIAATAALIAFAVCLVVGGLQAGNTFGTTVVRAIGAMVVTLVVGLIVGTMAQRMIEENVRSSTAGSPDPAAKENSSTKTGLSDR